jgi:hypothetical protein
MRFVVCLLLNSLDSHPALTTTTTTAATTTTTTTTIIRRPPSTAHRPLPTARLFLSFLSFLR